MKKQRGRPHLSEGEQRDTVLRIRLNPEERRILDNAAIAMNLPTSTWARTIILRAAETNSPAK